MTTADRDDEIDLEIPGFTGARRIGRGGFGTVYVAEQSGFGRQVAVKVLEAQLRDERVRARFHRECVALGRLSGHPNIITVFGGGLTPRDRPYLVMEYMHRGSLADLQAVTGRVDWRDAASFVVKSAGALETAHRAGILHRDIKPENVLISSYGEPMVADFGIARLQDAPATNTTAITTSVAHAAPEVLGGSEPTISWDVYALGSTLFTVVAGRYAFVRPTDDSIITAFARIAMEPVADLRPEGVPDAICEVIETAMAKPPEERYPTALAMARALQVAQRALGEQPTLLTVEGESPLSPVAPSRPPPPLPRVTPTPPPSAVVPPAVPGPLPGRPPWPATTSVGPAPSGRYAPPVPAPVVAPTPPPSNSFLPVVFAVLVGILLILVALVVR